MDIQTGQTLTGYTGQAAQDRQHRTGSTGQAAQDRQHRTGSTGQEEIAYGGQVTGKDICGVPRLPVRC